jgi:hypothetical protein
MCACMALFSVHEENFLCTDRLVPVPPLYRLTATIVQTGTNRSVAPCSCRSTDFEWLSPAATLSSLLTGGYLPPTS